MIDAGRVGRRLRNLAIAGLLTVLLGACGSHSGGDTQRERIPNLRLHALDATAGASDPRLGKTVILNFWATWCAPCRKEMASLQRLSDTLDSTRFAVIGISVDDDPNLVREAVARYGWRFARYHDSQREARDALAIDTLPRSYIVAADGHILRVINGALDWGSEEAAARVRALAAAHPAHD